MALAKDTGANTGKPKLHPAEAKVRDDYADSLDRQAELPGLEPDICRAMHAEANAIRGSMPYLDYWRALQAIENMPDDGRTGTGNIEIWAAKRDAKQRLEDANSYPPAVSSSIGLALNHGGPDDIDLYAVLNVPDPNAEKTTARPTFSQEYVDGLAVKAVARYQARAVTADQVTERMEKAMAARGLTIRVTTSRGAR